MIESKDKFEILRKLDNNNNQTQRNLSNTLGFSLGKLNYCLKSLKKHGLIKTSRFKESKNKKKYLYLLTSKGLKARSKLTISYMKLKMKEYDELKKESKKLKINL